MTRLTVRRLVTEDMGYCCLWRFFTLYRQTGLVAARLGVSTTAVKRHKAAVRDGCEGCQNKPNCMRACTRP